MTESTHKQIINNKSRVNITAHEISLIAVTLPCQRQTDYVSKKPVMDAYWDRDRDCVPENDREIGRKIEERGERERDVLMHDIYKTKPWNTSCTMQYYYNSI